MWIKLDDQWMDHPKVIAAGRDARDMWLASITYCAKHLTNGYFHANLLPTLAIMAGVDVANCQDFARRLLDVCLWDATDDGYMVHDFLDYNPTKDQALATREARKEAGRRGGVAKASKMLAKPLAKPLAKSWQKSAPSPSPYPLNNNKRVLSDDEPKSELTDKFTTLTGIVPNNLEKWTAADQQLHAAGVTPEELEVAVKKMDQDGLQYSNLSSVVSTAIWVHSQRQAGKPIRSKGPPPAARAGSPSWDEVLQQERQKLKEEQSDGET